MELLNKELRDRLLANGAESAKAIAKDGNTPDHEPVVKFFNPSGAATWLFTELADDGDTLFGLCDLGFGTPELGNASLAEIASVRGHLGLGIERDLHFRAKGPLSQYTEAASTKGRIDA